MALNAQNEIINGKDGIVVEGTAVRGGYFATDTLSDIPSYAQKEGQLCYCNEDNKFYQFKGGNWEVAAFGSDLNIEKGSGDGSNQTKDVIYTGEDIVYSDGMIGIKNGEIIEGGRASGIGAVALGGLRFGYSGITGTNIVLPGENDTPVHYKVEAYEQYEPGIDMTFYQFFFYTYDDYYAKNFGQAIEVYDNVTAAFPGNHYFAVKNFKFIENSPVPTLTENGKHCEIIVEEYLDYNDGLGLQPSGKTYTSSYYDQTSTSAEGNQSFAAGASVHAIGDWSVALGKDTAAYQRAGLAFGGGTQVGRTEEEFNDWFWDAATNTAKNGGKGKNTKGEITDEHGNSYNNAYSFALAGGGSSKAFARDSVALGSEAYAYAFGSKSLGYVTHTYGQFSVAIGNQTKVFSDHSFVGGTKSEVNSLYSFGFGDTIKINSLGSCNTAFGYRNEIVATTNICNNNFAANGENKIIDSSGKVNNAAVFGYQNTITNSGCLVTGHGNKTAGVYQTVIGEYANPVKEDAFVIGGGTSDSARKNVFTVGKTGNVDITGNLTIGGTTLKIAQLASKDGGALLINNDLTVGGSTTRLNQLFVDGLPGTAPDKDGYKRYWVDIGQSLYNMFSLSDDGVLTINPILVTKTK